MGALVERFIREEIAAREEFAGRFAEFAAKEQRALVKETLRVSRVLATYNIKGGVGKTSAAVNLATLAAHEGAPTLLWDLDPQGASTYLFRIHPKIKGGGRSSCAARPTPRPDQGHRHRRPRPAAGGLLLPPHGPRAGRRQEAEPPEPGARAARASTSTSSSTARRASASCPRTCSRPPTRCSSRSSPRRSPRGRSSSSRGARGRRAAGPRLLLDGRPPQEAASRADGQLAAEHDILETVIPSSAEVERMGAHRAALVDFAPRSRAARAYADLWEEVRARLTS